MSDLAEQFYTAWVASFGNRPRKLVCTWHVDRAWRENIRQLNDSQLQLTVYHSLRLLLEETDKQKFELLLKQTLEQLKKCSHTKDFARYFDTYYATRKKQWAACYRRDATVNTNMYVESFHRVLKHVYLKGRVNKRLDKFIYILLKLARDKRLIKFEKEKSTERLSMISTRHQSILTLSLSQVCKSDKPSTWTVASLDGKKHYTVTLDNQICPHQCALCCPDCKICVHIFTCDCADALIRATICKHIHIVARYYSQQSTLKQQNKDDSLLHGTIVSSVGADEKASLLETMQDNQHLHDIDSLRSKAQTQLLALSSQIGIVEDIKILNYVRHYITLAINVIKVGTATSSKLTLTSSAKKEPVNRSFFSTKKKRKCTHTRIRKPTTTEKEEISVALLQKCSTLYGKQMSLSKNTIS